jgi:UDP-N-acetylmuramate dehydrogenase
MRTETAVPLAPLTSLGVGGPAEHLITLEDTDSLPETLNALNPAPRWVLGYGSNTLIADSGLPGTTLLLRNTAITVEGKTIVAGAGAWWDNLVRTAIDHGLWGVELMSGIPGSVGAGVFININAYGQALTDTLAWVEVWDPTSGELRRFAAADLPWGYKQSAFQKDPYAKMIVLRAAFTMAERSGTALTYQSAFDIASELQRDPNDLAARRDIILETRQRAASIYVPGHNDPKTAGSFFRNPIVTPEQAETIMAADETGKTRAQITAMNAVHGGNTMRVSAAHVLLAAGFHRGQTWGNVKLNDKHLLKLENAGGATAQEIYNVARLLQETVRERLGVTLETEVCILGDFSEPKSVS